MDSWRPVLTLQALRDHHTVTEAAAVLRMSPSAVSQQLQQLERRTGRRLTALTGRRLSVTPDGHALLDATLPLIAELQQQLRRRPDQGAMAGRVRIASFTSALRGGLLDSVADLERAHPDLRCSIIEADPAQAHTALRSGSVDLAVVHHWHGQQRPVHPDLDWLEFGHDVADVICRADRDADQPGPTFAALAEHDWVSTGPGTLCHDWLLQLFAAADHRPRIIASLSDFTLHLDFVAAGLGLALVPRLGRPALPPALRAIELPQPPRRVLAIALRRNQLDDPLLTGVRDQLAGIA